MNRFSFETLGRCVGCMWGLMWYCDAGHQEGRRMETVWNLVLGDVLTAKALKNSDTHYWERKMYFWNKIRLPQNKGKFLPFIRQLLGRCSTVKFYKDTQWNGLPAHSATPKLKLASKGPRESNSEDAFPAPGLHVPSIWWFECTCQHMVCAVVCAILPNGI